MILVNARVGTPKGGIMVFVLNKDGQPLMPTWNIKKVRRLLKNGLAVIAGHKPGFTIRLLYDTTNNTQPIEFCEDTGYSVIGISAKSAKHEFVSEERTLLRTEKSKHDDRQAYRHERRIRKRYRAPRFDNRRTPKKWLAPSIRHKADEHTKAYIEYKKVLPITSVHLEVAQFDTQMLEAIESGKPLPQGKDYQHGPMYGHDTLREAVFYRDNYTCKCCGKSPLKDKNVILRMHHLGFRKNDHTDRMSNLATICSKCHTPKNHKPGGKLYDLKPNIKPLTGAAFMNSVRHQIYDAIKEIDDSVNVNKTYGAITKRERLNRRIKKTHANDAYCIGKFRPKHRMHATSKEKTRRHNRILMKFYDAKYIDLRDGKEKSASELSCNRTNRSVPRNNPLNERIYRGPKIRTSRKSVQTTHYAIRPGDTVRYNNKRFEVVGIHSYGKYIYIKTGDTKLDVKTKDITVLQYANGWKKLDNTRMVSA